MADYNINAVTRRVVFTGSAGLGPYAFTFEILDDDDLAVYFNTTKLTKTTDYSVTIAANGTGSVTVVVNVGGNIPETPDANDTIIILGARDIERVTDFVTAGDLLASSLNEQLDSLTIFDQQVAEEQKRSMQAPVYDPAHVDDGGTLDMTLPAKDTRKGKTLQFNATTGNPEAGPTIDAVANAQTNATNAAASATAAASSATSASGSATTATTKAAEASTSAAAAAASQTASAASETASAASQTASAASEAAAASSASSASTSAATSTTKAAEAATSASNASTAQTAAETAQTAAEAAKTAAELAADNFDDTYLGAKSSDPTVDNDGDALTAGDLYFNTTSDQLKYYTGSAWVAIAPGIANVSEDTTPQLGGNLDVQTNSIVSTSNRDINISPNGTGTVVINTDLDVDNININGNTVSSTNTNGDINLTPNGTGDVVLGGDVKIGDSDVLYIGDGLDLQIQHSGSGSFITDAGNGDLHIRSDDALRIQNAAGSKNKAVFTSNGAVTLYHDNSAKISTGSTGIVVTGNVDASGTVFGTNQILQVKKVTLSSTTQLTSSGAAHELSTSLRLAITPKASDSLLYLNFFAPFVYPNSNNLSYAYFYNVTGTAAVGIPAAGGSRMATTWHKRTTAFDANDMDTLNMHAVITADNTNARTYTIYHRTEGAVAQFLQSTLSSAAGTNTVAFFWIMEVAA